MKLLDEVRLIRDDEEYQKEGAHKGMVGTIIDSEIMFRTFHVIFIDERVKDKEFMSNEDNINLLKEDICVHIKIQDLELVRESNMTDEDILHELPSPDPRWWCKVEDGFILNLKGEKLNKIAYDYES